MPPYGFLPPASPRSSRKLAERPCSSVRKRRWTRTISFEMNATMPLAGCVCRWK